MLDVLKYAHDERLIERDPDGHLFDLEPWSPRRCEQRALAEGIELTEAHWEVIHALREHYREHGPASARQLTALLKATFTAGQGGARLYELFPGGPVTQGCKLAGLPVPSGSIDKSFGSTQ